MIKNYKNNNKEKLIMKIKCSMKKFNNNDKNE